jgi:hypothetical protein
MSPRIPVSTSSVKGTPLRRPRGISMILLARGDLRRWLWFDLDEAGFGSRGNFAH